MIYKYQPPEGIPGATIHHVVPRGARIVGMCEQTGCVYALVDPDEFASDQLTLTVIATGQHIPSSLLDDEVSEYVGLWKDGDYIWHVFATKSWGAER